MIRLLMCIFGLHGAREIDYTNEQKNLCMPRVLEENQESS